MPGWAGSSFYWMRYMDAHNENHSKESVDCYTWQRTCNWTFIVSRF
jgi:leucyl-tRNA synthetase